MKGIELRELAPSDLERIREVDRSERVTVQYILQDGALKKQSVDWDVPRWPEDGPDDFSVRGLMKSWGPILQAGGKLIGAFSGDELIGFAILKYDLSPGVSELVALYVDSKARRRGIAKALTDEVERLATEAGANSLCVSATPSEATVDFYSSCGFVLAENPNEELTTLEPEDIQMEKPL